MTTATEKPLYADIAIGTLASPIDDSTTEITLQGLDPSRFPTPGAGEFITAFIRDRDNDLYEEIEITARSNFVLTVRRGIGGTARAWTPSQSVYLYCAPSAGEFDLLRKGGRIAADETWQVSVGGTPALSVDGSDLSVTAAADVNVGGDLSVAGSLTAASLSVAALALTTLAVSGLADLNGNLDVAGDATVGGALNVSGAISASAPATFEAGLSVTGPTSVELGASDDFEILAGGSTAFSVEGATGLPSVGSPGQGNRELRVQSSTGGQYAALLTDGANNIFRSANATAQFETIGAHDLILQTNNTDALRVSGSTQLVTLSSGLVVNYDSGIALSVNAATGRVGVGTSSPDEELHVSGVANVFARVQASGADSTTGYQFRNDARTWGLYLQGAGSDRLAIRDETAGSNRLEISTAGVFDSGNLRFNGFGASPEITGKSGDRLNFVTFAGMRMEFFPSGTMALRLDENQLVTCDSGLQVNYDSGTALTVDAPTGRSFFRQNVGIGSGPSTGDGDLLRTDYSNPGRRSLTWFRHTDNTDGNSDVRVLLETGGAASGDPYINFQVDGQSNFSFGIHNADGDKLKLTTSDVVSSSVVLEVEPTTKMVSVYDGFTVPVFADATAEGLAPTAEGAVAFRADTDKLRLYAGGAWGDVN